MEESVKPTGGDAALQIPPGMSPEEAKALSALNLAFIGDTVFDLLVRTALVTKKKRPVNEQNAEAASLVNARNQSRMTGILEPLLNEDEKAVYLRGRNAKSATRAKNASIQDYRRATGLEAVFGYLYLQGKTGRILELYAAANDEAKSSEKERERT